MKARGFLLALALVTLGCDKKPEARAGTDAAVPPASAARVPADAPSPFSIVARSPGRVQAFSLGDATFVSAGRILYQADAKGLHQDVHLLSGFGGTLADAARGGGEGFELTGFWPDGAWLQAWAQDSAAESPIVSSAAYRWVKDRWGRTALVANDEALLGIANFRKRTALALIGNDDGVRLAIANDKGYLDFQPTPTPWAKAADAGGAKAAEENPESTAGLEGGAGACRTEVRGLGRPVRAFEKDGSSLTPGYGALAAFESGEIYIAGTSCTDGDARWLVERYNPKTKKSSIDTLPKPADGAARPHFVFAARAPDDVWLLVKEGGALWHFDGKSWQAEATSGAEKLVDLGISKQGTLWAITPEAVLRRDKDSAWKRIELPKAGASALSPLELAVGGDDAIWIAARGGPGSVLLGNLTPAPAAIELPSGKAAELSADIVRYPASPVCEQPFVLLLEHVKPSDRFTDVIALVKDVPGIVLLTESSQKWTYLGAKVPSLEAGRSVIEKMKAHPKSAAALYCHDPKNAKMIPYET